MAVCKDAGVVAVENIRHNFGAKALATTMQSMKKANHSKRRDLEHVLLAGIVGVSFCGTPEALVKRIHLRL